MVTKLIKRLARRVLREEFAVLTQLYFEARDRAVRAEVRGDNELWARQAQAAKFKDMRAWGMKHGQMALVAWHDHITQPIDRREFGIVHPFDRWQVTPKP